MGQNRKPFIPDTPALRYRIREEADKDKPQPAEGGAEDLSGFEYHHLLAQIRSKRGIKSRIKQVIFLLSRFITIWQEQFNRKMQSKAKEVDKSLAELARCQKELDNRLEMLRADKELDNRLEMLRADVEERLKAQRRLMFKQGEKMWETEESEPDGQSEKTSHPSADLPAESRAGFSRTIAEDIYAAFEQRFRGCCREVEKRLSVYLSLIKEKFPPEEVYALDIGCGRGEWLQCLAGQGIKAKGIDTSSMLVNQCRQQGLEADQAEAAAFLENMPGESFQVITAFHVIEHINFDKLAALIDQAYRTLSPGGILILETPNPVNILVSACDFYRDPTHLRPVHPQTAQFVADYRGFAPTELKLVVRGEEKSVLEDFDKWKLDSIYDYTSIARDYAMIGYKPEADRNTGKEL